MHCDEATVSVPRMGAVENHISIVCKPKADY